MMMTIFFFLFLLLFSSYPDIFQVQVILSDHQKLCVCIWCVCYTCTKTLHNIEIIMRTINVFLLFFHRIIIIERNQFFFLYEIEEHFLRGSDIISSYVIVKYHNQRTNERRSDHNNDQNDSG